MASDTAHKGWYEALDAALRKEDMAVMQLATVDDHDRPRPSVRTLVHRAFIAARTIPTIPLLLTTTDIRARKVDQLAAHDVVEVAYWAQATQAQFRILGRAAVVPARGSMGRANLSEFPAPPSGVVYDALEEEGFDWEEKRRETFNALGGHLRATFCRPAPGTSLRGDEDEGREWPTTLPRLGEAKTELERVQSDEAFRNFALLVVAPFEVDHLELGNAHRPDRRTRYCRDWNERDIVFREELIVP